MHKFSKFIHGSSVLLPDMVQAVPYWIDDTSVRKSIIQSSREQCVPLEPSIALLLSFRRSLADQAASTRADQQQQCTRSRLLC